MGTTTSSVRLFVHLARRTAKAVVLRRGPSKQVRLIAWNREDDSFERGQWLKGRVFEQRSDLSPSGETFIYFASTQRPPFLTYTAISRPPYFTALALWPKGDTWGGGGLFADDHRVQLNHPLNQTKLAEGFSLGKRVRVELLGDRAGAGEDHPIAHLRMLRDGWTLRSEGKRTDYSYERPFKWEYVDTEVYAKHGPKPRRLRLERHLHGIGERDGPWYAFSHRVLDEKSGECLDLGRTDWADWDRNDDLLFAREGRLHRVRFGDEPLADGYGRVRAIADFRDDRFEAIAPSLDAQRW